MAAGVPAVHLKRSTVGAPDVPAACGLHVAAPDATTRVPEAVTCASCQAAALCRFCRQLRPAGYAVTCGRSRCQQADAQVYVDAAAARRQRRPVVR